MLDVKFPIYGLLITFSVFIGLIIMFFEIKKAKYEKKELLILLLYMYIGIVAGAKYFTFFTNMKKYDYKFDFLRAGLSSYGALIGMLVMIYVFHKQFKKDLIEILKAMCIATPLMYAIGKIGCFLAGCCYGINYNGFGYIVYHYTDRIDNVNLFPVQLCESITFFIIFIIIILMNKKYDSRKTTGISLILCGTAKFGWDFLRANRTMFLSINQYTSIIFVLLGIFLIFKDRILKKRM